MNFLIDVFGLFFKSIISGRFPNHKIQYLKNKYEYLIYIYTFFWINLNFYNFIIIEEINKKLKFLENYFLIYKKYFSKYFTFYIFLFII